MLYIRLPRGAAALGVDANPSRANGPLGTNARRDGMLRCPKSTAVKTCKFQTRALRLPLAPT